METRVTQPTVPVIKKGLEINRKPVIMVSTKAIPRKEIIIPKIYHSTPPTQPKGVITTDLKALLKNYEMENFAQLNKFCKKGLNVLV
ncbi:MAG: hypothetical protein E7Z87_02555 [Cyanobacteria bacterium SIG26]|nr:hypothetical protein [Cyanobacteria bacterium SIG26]